NFGAHLLRFVDQEYRADPGGSHMGFPAFPECFESAPTIVWRELHRENIAQLSIEVGTFRLRPFDHTNRDVAHRLKPPGDNPQRHRFASAGLTRDQREAPPWTSCSTRQAKCSILGVASSPSLGSSGENGFHFSPQSESSFLPFMMRLLRS